MTTARAVIVLAMLMASAPAYAKSQFPETRKPTLLFNLPDGMTQESGKTQLEWNYTFLRGSRLTRVYNENQTIEGTRRQDPPGHLARPIRHDGSHPA